MNPETTDRSLEDGSPFRLRKLHLLITTYHDIAVAGAR
jgi:hypothetical protein